MSKAEPIFGLHTVQAVLKSAPQRIQQLLVLRGRQDQRVQKILASAQRQDIPVKILDRKEMDALVDGNHQGVIALALPGELHDEKFLYRLLEELEATPFLLVLDGVTDPHNLGACLRTAEAAGVQAVIAPKDNSATLTAVARKDG